MWKCKDDSATTKIGGLTVDVWLTQKRVWSMKLNIESMDAIELTGCTDIDGAKRKALEIAKALIAKCAADIDKLEQDA